MEVKHTEGRNLMDWSGVNCKFYAVTGKYCLECVDEELLYFSLIVSNETCTCTIQTISILLSNEEVPVVPKFP